ncbi:MAG: hypothetical protein WC551_08640 [Patescibacteria group bacterium]
MTESSKQWNEHDNGIYLYQGKNTTWGVGSTLKFASEIFDSSLRLVTGEKYSVEVVKTTDYNIIYRVVPEGTGVACFARLNRQNVFSDGEFRKLSDEPLNFAAADAQNELSAAAKAVAATENGDYEVLVGTFTWCGSFSRADLDRKTAKLNRTADRVEVPRGQRIRVEVVAATHMGFTAFKITCLHTGKIIYGHCTAEKFFSGSSTFRKLTDLTSSADKARAAQDEMFKKISDAENGTYYVEGDLSWSGVRNLDYVDLEKATAPYSCTFRTHGERISVQVIAVANQKCNSWMSVLYRVSKKGDEVYGHIDTPTGLWFSKKPDVTKLGTYLEAFDTEQASESDDKEDIMKDLATTVTVTNNKALAATRRGVEQAAARAAHKALVAQVRKLMGPKFPKAFFATPMGAALLDLGSCYLVMLATETAQQHPLAAKANVVAQTALTAAMYDHATPLIETATKLVEAAAGISILAETPEE